MTSAKDLSQHASFAVLKEKWGQKAMESPVSVPDSHIQAIGALVAAFQILEFAMQEIAWLELGMSEASREYVVRALSFGRLTACLRTFCQDQREPRHAELLALVKLAGDVEQVRNQFVHSIWTGPQRGKFKGSKLVVEQFDDSEIQQVAEVAGHAAGCGIWYLRLYFEDKYPMDNS